MDSNTASSARDRDVPFVIEKRIAIAFGNGFWVPETKTVGGVDYLKLSSADGGLARFCGLRKPELRDSDFSAQHPWVGNTFLPWLRSLYKAAIDEELAQIVRLRNSEPTMKLPWSFPRYKE